MAEEKAPKPARWRELATFIEAHNTAFSLGVALVAAAAATVSGLIAVVQILILINERTTPYRTAVHASQIDAARAISAAAVQFWETLGAGMRGCEGLITDPQTWSWETSVKPRLDREAEAYFGFRKALYHARPVLSPKVTDAVGALSDLIYTAASTYGSRTCEESVQLTKVYQAETDRFLDVYFAFLNAARADVRIEELSKRPILDQRVQ
jgi:hypothetical protein